MGGAGEGDEGVAPSSEGRDETWLRTCLPPLQIWDLLGLPTALFAGEWMAACPCWCMVPPVTTGGGQFSESYEWDRKGRAALLIMRGGIIPSWCGAGKGLFKPMLPAFELKPSGWAGDLSLETWCLSGLPSRQLSDGKRLMLSACTGLLEEKFVYSDGLGKLGEVQCRFGDREPPGVGK